MTARYKTGIQLRIFIALALFIGAALVQEAKAQVITHEDSLNAGLVPSRTATVLSGYGEAKYRLNLRDQTATVNITRFVTFFGHKFSRNISFFSETEIENTKVDGSGGGEISLEQAFLKMNVNRVLYFTAGLFVPRIGLINENHLPTTYNGNDRPQVEQTLIPATWREIGVGLYGSPRSMPGFNYSLAVCNGLNAQGFGNGTGIQGGRFEGRNATARNLAVTGALLYYTGAWRLQTSMYYGGSVGVSNNLADSLHLQTGTFGSPVLLNEANVQYHNKGFTFRALGAILRIPDAKNISAAYANLVPLQCQGAYAELGYDLLTPFRNKAAALLPDSVLASGLPPGKLFEKRLVLFVRGEYLDMQSDMPSEVPADPQHKKRFITVGLTYAPVQGVTLKADFQAMHSGTPNPLLNPNPAAHSLNPYYNSASYVNIGLGYSF